MLQLDQNSKPLLIFPENSASIIKNVLKKYDLLESNEELLAKWKRREKSRGEILADLVIQISKTNLSVGESVSLAQKELNLPIQKTKKIIEELTREIITPTTQLVKKIPSIGDLLSLEK